MTPNSSVARVSVKEDLGSLLMLRSSVPPLFRRISRMAATRVVVDFSGVEFMSRSFADEYLEAKRSSKKSIDERNVSDEVARMLNFVTSQRLSVRSRTQVAKRGYPQPRMISTWRSD